MEADRTILFADICNSTGITEAVGDAESRQHFASILGELGDITRRLDGVVVKTIGDEIMCAFERPTDALAAAVDMQRALSIRPPVGGIPSAVKIGVHSGPVILEAGDVFGDVVNVAARVISLAAGEQVLTTGDTLDGTDHGDVPFRSLGNHQVRGRDGELHLCEVMWRGETAAMTAVAPKLDALPTPEIEFRMGDRLISMTANANQPITLGRGEESSFVVPGNSASRAHARIVRRGTRFYLEDHSTNGTYMKPNDGNEIFVHRDEVQLQGAGRIRLGEPVSVKGPLDIEFETVYRDPTRDPR
jgi:adenylate cyclase